MQAACERGLEVSLFGFEGAGKRLPLAKEKAWKRDEVFFAYFLFQKKVCAFSSVGRATDS